MARGLLDPGASMEAMISMTNTPVPLGEYVPTADQRIVLRGLSWAGYQTLRALRGDRRSPRMAYLDGSVELMGTSREHEGIKGCLGRLVEAFCTVRGIPWTTFGNWLLDDESEEAGLEPDECYVFGPDPLGPDRPQLAIEVVWTSGGINKLEIYRRLGVGEVWFWKRDVIQVFVLSAAGYEEAPRSACLPEIDLGVLCELAPVRPTSDAVARLHDRLRGG
jgi:Uma2 family endonuclease